jgi:cysteine-rich repeat protein
MGWAGRHSLAAAAVTLAVLGGSAGAQGVIDQQTTCNDGGSAQIQFYEPIAQRFTPASPNLVAVELLLGRFNPPYADTLTMRLVEDSIDGAFVAAVSSVVSAGPTFDWHRFELPDPVLVVPGASYVIELDATNAALGWAHQYELPPRCTYADGEEIVSGMPVDGLDAAFRTYTLCGNGTRDPGEQCDDGNRTSDDGCTIACTVCGDGVVAPGEECDDGNLVSGDGCDANCTVTACGNGIQTAGETCDDGNRISGDCCSGTCQLEPSGSSCADDGNECTSDVCDGTGACTHPNDSAPCSDGNLCNGDDFCSNGSCSVHVGNPCASEPACTRTCVQTSSLQYACTVDPPGTPCTSDGVACTNDVCNGAGACTHPTAPNGASCDDGDRCTVGDTCQSGACLAGAETTCDPCLACDPQSGGCAVPDASACFQAAPEKSSIVLHHGANAATNKVVWRWRGLGDVEKAALGSPSSGTGFRLCVFDRDRLRLSASVPPGGTCAGKPCWRDFPFGYRYADPDGTPDGIQKLQTRAGRASQAKIAVKGRGARLDLPTLAFDGPVTVRLGRSDGGACWTSSFSVPTASDDVQFRAKSD